MSEQAPPLGHNKNHPLRDLRGTLPAHHPSNFCLSCRPPCVSWSLGVSVSSLCLYASVFLSDFSIHTPGYSISLCLYPSVSILASCPSSPVPPFGLSLFSLSSRSHLVFPLPVPLLSLGVCLSWSFLSPHLCLVSGVSSSPDSASVCLTISLSGSISPLSWFFFHEAHGD